MKQFIDLDMAMVVDTIVSIFISWTIFKLDKRKSEDGNGKISQYFDTDAMFEFMQLNQFHVLFNFNLLVADILQPQKSLRTVNYDVNVKP